MPNPDYYQDNITDFFAGTSIRSCPKTTERPLGNDLYLGLLFTPSALLRPECIRDQDDSPPTPIHKDSTLSLNPITLNTCTQLEKTKRNTLLLLLQIAPSCGYITPPLIYYRSEIFGQISFKKHFFFRARVDKT